MIKIKYLADIPKIEKLQIGDWIDLRCAEEVELYQGEYKEIPLGIAMELPEGYEAHVVPRSSTFKRWGIIQTNSVGIIDHSYCGDNDEWHMPVYATQYTEIHKGDRICQFRIVKTMNPLVLQEVETLGNTDRGGLGSTGAN